MKIYLNIILVVLMLGCGSNDNSSKHHYQREFSEDGTLIHEGIVVEGVKLGTHKWYYQSGNLALLNNYQEGVEEGCRFQFFDVGEPKIQLKATYSNGFLVDTTFIFDINGKCVSKEIYYSDPSFYHKIMLSESGKIIQKSEFVKVLDLYDGDYFHNTFIFFDTLGNVLTGSCGYAILNEQNEYFKDSSSFLNIYVLPLYGQNVSLMYGDIKEGFRVNGKSITTERIFNNRIRIPLKTEKEGDHTIRFVIEDSKSDSIGIHIKSIYGRYKYSVLTR